MEYETLQSSLWFLDCCPLTDPQHQRVLENILVESLLKGALIGLANI